MAEDDEFVDWIEGIRNPYAKRVPNYSVEELRNIFIQEMEDLRDGKGLEGDIVDPETGITSDK